MSPMKTVVFLLLLFFFKYSGTHIGPCSGIMVRPPENGDRNALPSELVSRCYTAYEARIGSTDGANWLILLTFAN